MRSIPSLIRPCPPFIPAKEPTTLQSGVSKYADNRIEPPDSSGDENPQVKAPKNDIKSRTPPKQSTIALKLLEMTKSNPYSMLAQKTIQGPPQKTIQENLIQLDRLREQAKLRHETGKVFSIQFAFNVIKKNINLAEVVNLLVAAAGTDVYRVFSNIQDKDVDASTLSQLKIDISDKFMPAKIQGTRYEPRYETFNKIKNLNIGRYVAAMINTFKEAFQQVVTGTKEQYQELLNLLTAETAGELAKTSPEIQKICADIRQDIHKAIDSLDERIAPGDKRIKVINGMFFWHQWLMGIPSRPDKLFVNERIKEHVLRLMPSDGIREKLRYEFTRFESNFKQPLPEPGTARTPASELDFFRRHVFILHEGLPGLGKTYTSGLVTKIYDEGLHSVTIPPSTPYLFRPAEVNPALRDSEQMWLLTPRQVFGEVSELIAMGYKVFQFEEAEKYFLPSLQRIAAEGRTDFAGVPAELKHDADPNTDFLHYPFGRFNIPIPFNMVLFDFNTNKNFKEIYKNTWPELFRRFQVVIPYRTATDESLKAAYKGGLEKALTLTDNAALRKTIKEKFAVSVQPRTSGNVAHNPFWGTGLRELVLQSGIKQLERKNITPDQTSSITETVLGNLVTELHGMSDAQIDNYLNQENNKTKILNSIDNQWEYFVKNLKNDEKQKKQTGQQPAQPLPPDLAALFAPKNFAAAALTKQERKSAYDICLETLEECARESELAGEDTDSVSTCFRDHDTLNKIVQIFKSTFEMRMMFNGGGAGGTSDDESDNESIITHASAVEPDFDQAFFDRQILREAVRAAYSSFQKMVNDGGIKVEDVQAPIQAVFARATDFERNPKLARDAINLTLGRLQLGLEDEQRKAVGTLFLKHDPVTTILNWFRSFRFATPNILEKVTQAVHEYLSDNYNSESFKAMTKDDVKIALNEVMLAAFKSGRELNGENLYKLDPEKPPLKMPFLNDLRLEKPKVNSAGKENLNIKLHISSGTDDDSENQSYTGTMAPGNS